MNPSQLNEALLSALGITERGISEVQITLRPGVWPQVTITQLTPRGDALVQAVRKLQLAPLDPARP